MAYWVDRPCSGGVGEPDLVVDHDVKGAADVEARKPTLIEEFLDHALAGEGGIAVNEERKDCIGVAVRGRAPGSLALGPVRTGLTNSR